MTARQEAEAAMKEFHQWTDPPTNLTARPIDLPPMLPIKDAEEGDED